MTPASKRSGSCAARDTSHYALTIDETEDVELVARAVGGDDGALDTLLRRHHDRVYALCRRMAGNDADGADATQEALIAIVRGLPRFDGRSRFTTWVHRVAVNACLDELRRRQRRPVPIPDDAMANAAASDGTAAVADRIDIDAALVRLPLEYRVAVVLRDLCTLDYAEIAEILDVPVGTVRSRIARGRTALVPLLDPDGNSDRPAKRPTSRP
jgi:RNA polymerase sigma-70 factor (ECF subfamily)